MDWRRADAPTKAGVVATVLAVLGIAFPLLGAGAALVAVACSTVAVVGARRREESNRVAVICLAISVGLIVLVVIGSVIYGSTN